MTDREPKLVIVPPAGVWWAGVVLLYIIAGTGVYIALRATNVSFEIASTKISLAGNAAELQRQAEATLRERELLADERKRLSEAWQRLRERAATTQAIPSKDIKAIAAPATAPVADPGKIERSIQRLQDIRQQIQEAP